MLCSDNCCLKSICCILDGCLHLIKGIALLLPFFVHELILFLVILSVCVGMTAVVSFFHEICWYRPLATDVQAVLALIFITAIGEGVSLVMRPSQIAIYYRKIGRRFPWISGTVKGLFLLSSFSLAITHLYLGYKNGHPSSYFQNQKVPETELFDPGTLNATSTFLVLCSLSFLTYAIPRFTDWMIYRFHLNPEELYIQIGSKLYIVFYVAQTLLLCVYALPLAVLSFMCYFMDLSPPLVFSLLVLNGVGIGLNVSYVENLYLARFEKMRPPNYPYENHLAARVNLFQYVLIPMVAVAYYGTGPISSLDSETQFLLYAILVSLALLQASKCIFNTQYLEEAFQRFGRMLRNVRVEQYLIAVEAEAQVPPEGAGPGTQDENIIAPPPDDDVDAEKNGNAKEAIGNQVMDEILQNVAPGAPELVNSNQTPKTCEVSKE